MIEYNLDKLLTESPAGGVILLQPGIYTTMGYGTYPSQPDLGVKGKTRTCIIGAGVGVTTIKCIRETGDCTTLHLDEGSIVSDLTIDCNPPPTFQTGARSGVRIDGAGFVNRVKVINVFGSLEDKKESFAIVAGRSKPGIGVITNCQVTSILGNYTSGIMGTFVDNCSVEWHSPIDDGVEVPRFRVAYNIGDSKGTRISNCRCRNADNGVYSDYRICTDAKIFNNLFTNVRHGVNLNVQTAPDHHEVTGVNGVEIFNNTILLQRTGKEVSGVVLDHTNVESVPLENKQNYIHDVLIYNNIIKFVELGDRRNPIPTYPNALNIASFLPKEKITPTLGISKIRFIDNKCDPKMIYRDRHGIVNPLISPAPANIVTNY